MSCKACHLKKAVCFFGKRPLKKVWVDKTGGTDKGEGSSHQTGRKVEVIKVEDKDEGTGSIMSAARLVGQKLRGLRAEMVAWRRESRVKIWELKGELAHL
jgi:hypothetical protein